MIFSRAPGIFIFKRPELDFPAVDGLYDAFGLRPPALHTLDGLGDDVVGLRQPLMLGREPSDQPAFAAVGDRQRLAENILSPAPATSSGLALSGRAKKLGLRFMEIRDRYPDFAGLWPRQAQRRLHRV